MNKLLREPAVLALTASRLWQAADLAKRVKAGRSVVGATADICLVDLADGVLARKAGVDGPKRRALDSAVDSAIITAGLLSTFRKQPKARPYIWALAAREAFVASGWALDLLKTKQVKKGDNFHKLPSLSIAAFGLAANHGTDRTMKLAGTAAIAINGALAFDYYKGWTDRSRNTMLDNGVEEVPGFYGVKVAAKKLARTLPQLDASPAPLLLEAPKDEVIDLPPDAYIELQPDEQF